MPRLSFSAPLSEDEDTKMVDASPISAQLPVFDFEFDVEESDLTLMQFLERSSDSDQDNFEPRSPRTPTYKGEASVESSNHSPFNPDRFLMFPVLEPSDKSSSPLSTLTYSSAAKTHVNLHSSHIVETESHKPVLPPRPKSPLLWIWTCHLCRSRYPLGATRRCLVDGHLYCSGDNGSPSQRNVKRKKRGQACSSEFDYAGWHERSCWKEDMIGTARHTLSGSKSSTSLDGCQGCEYPSECRYLRMNKVPDVVAGLSKKIDHEVERQPRPGEKKNVVPKVEKKGNLKVDTASSSSQKGKRSDQDGRTVKGEKSGPSFTELNPILEMERALQSSSSPISPDLVDLPTIYLEIDTSMTNNSTK